MCKVIVHTFIDPGPALLHFFLREKNTKTFRTVQCEMRWNMKNRNENTSRKALDMLGTRRPRWDRRVIKSLGDVVRVVHMERMVGRVRRESMVTHDSQNSEHHVRMVAQLRRERMVAHDFANYVVLGVPCEQGAGRSLRDMCRS